MSFSRRTIVRGAWAAPAIIATTQVPVYAASRSTSNFYPTAAAYSVSPSLTYLDVSADGTVTPSWGDWSYNTDSRSDTRVTLTSYTADGLPLGDSMAVGSESISIVRHYDGVSIATTVDPSAKPADGQRYANQSAYFTSREPGHWDYHRMDTSMVHSFDTAVADGVVYIAGAIDESAAIVSVDSTGETVLFTMPGNPYGRVTQLILVDDDLYAYVSDVPQPGLYRINRHTGQSTMISSLRSQNLWIINNEPIALLTGSVYNLRTQTIIGYIPRTLRKYASFSDGSGLWLLINGIVYKFNTTTGKYREILAPKYDAHNPTALAAWGSKIFVGYSNGYIGIFPI